MKGTAGSPCWKRFAAAWRTKGLSFDAAARRVAREVVFTTHTPVPAGHDRFQRGPDGRAPGTAARIARAFA